MRLCPLFVLPLLLMAAGCPRRSLNPAKPTGEAIRFTDAAPQMGLRYHFDPGGKSPLNILETTLGAGVAFLDYDGDGWMDALCVGLPHPALFHNERGSRFTEVTPGSGLPTRSARWNGCATGDINNDGYVDLYLTAYNDSALLLNDGHGRFKEVTDSAGVHVKRWSSSAAFADVNGDGLLDLYVGCYVEFKPGMPEFFETRGVKLPLGPLAYQPQKGYLFLNRGGGKFEDVTASSGLSATHGKCLGVAFADADGDGDDDLYIANDEEPQDFFRNDGHGHFENVAMENGTAFNGEGERQGGMGLDWGDFDGDGRLDLFVGTFADELKGLYRGTPSGLYASATITSGLAQPTRRWVVFGTKFLDADQDGRPDLMIVNGHVRDLVQQVDPQNSYPQKSQLFLNSGGGRFRDASASVGPDFQRPIVGRGLAIGDFDNDGDLDALAADLGGQPVLFRNDGGHEAGNWLMLHLTGTRSNRMAIGARVEITAGGQRQLKELRTDGSYLSAHDPRVHFGLGAAKMVEEIRIRWPSGKRQTLKNVAANQVLEVREP